MSKFEQLLDLIVNEEHEKANELFHEIVVEKSREIYENLIAEEAEEEEMDETVESTTDEEVDESADEESDDEDMDESVDLEDSFEVQGADEFGGDATDDMLGDVEVDDEEEMGDEEGEEGGEDKAIFDIKNAIADLEAAFADLEQSQESEESDMDMGDEEDDMDMGDETSADEMVGFMEGRRVTREYVEKVGNDWEKNSQKGQGQSVGSGSGEKDGAPVEGKSPIASGKNKPGPAGVGAGNIAQGAAEGQSNTGTSPGKVNHGITSKSGEEMGKGQGNVPGGKMGVKNLSKVAGGHGAEKKGGGAGPVGSGTGDKAGQTSVSSDQQFLKPYSK